MPVIITHEASNRFIDDITREHYGTDVPTLRQEIARLEETKKRLKNAMLERMAECHRLYNRYDAAKKGYDAAREELRSLRRERWRGYRRERIITSVSLGEMRL